MTVTAVPIQPVKRSYLVWLWIGIAVLIAAAFLLARQGDYYRTTASGLQYHVMAAGSGAHPTDNDVAVVMYEGRLPDGTVFDQSQQPTPMPVKGVVPGFAEALKMMAKGARYRFTIPAKLAYGASPPPGSPIPANSPSIFDVQVLAVLTQQEYRDIMMRQMMMNGGGAGGPPGRGGPPGGEGGAPGGESVAPGGEGAPPPGM